MDFPLYCQSILEILVGLEVFAVALNIFRFVLLTTWEHSQAIPFQERFFVVDVLFFNMLPQVCGHS